MATFGRAVAAARQLRNLTVQQTAARIADAGFDRPTARMIGAIERGERPARADEIQALATVLDVPLTWLFDGPEWLREPVGDRRRGYDPSQPVAA